jgi:hypothetical protein
MRKWLSIILAASLLLYPFATFADDYGSQPSQTQQGPPVAQPLVREGDFAVKLAATLDLGNTTDEAVAEDLLAKAGVAPVNGWLSDYPMTPQIVGQLRDSVAKAAGEGKLPMTSDEATRKLNYLTAKLDLPTPAGPGTAETEGTRPPADQSNPTVISNYYYDQGPPVITYYPPPYDYGYLYDWVPYPAWWFGFWFPGFFICHNFTTTVVVNNGVFVNRRFVNRTAVVSNHVVDPVTRTVVRVDPVGRRGAGTARHETMLRTESGRTFTTLAELRKVTDVTGPNAGRPGSSIKSAPRTERFQSPAARKSAEAIYSRSIAGARDGRRPERSAYRGGERQSAVSNRPYGPPASRRSNGSFRPYNGQGTPGRTHNYNGAMRGNERRYVTPGPGPSAGRYSGSGPVMRGGSQPTRSLSGSGGQGRGSYSRTYAYPRR